MGNSSLYGKTKPKLHTLVDMIAANYITTQTFDDMKNISTPGYCDKMIVLTTSAISSNLHNKEIQYVSDRISGKRPTMRKENVIVMDPSRMTNYDVMDRDKKMNMCKGIAAFYVKIAQVFAAIHTTVRPSSDRNIVDTNFYDTSYVSDMDTYGEREYTYSGQSTPIFNHPQSEDAINPDESNPEDAINPDESKPEDAINPDESNPEDAINPDESNPEDAINPDESKPEDAINPDESKPEDAINPYESKPEDAINPYESKPEQGYEPPLSSQIEKDPNGYIASPEEEQSSQSIINGGSIGDTELLSYAGICGVRISDLEDMINESTDYININEKFCRNGRNISLGDEPGIPELEILYYDVYDYDLGVFNAMSKEAEKQYQIDLERFYFEFTGLSNMPQSITKFGDIKLNQYDKECDYTSVYSKSYHVSGSNRLMVKYARHIKTMIDSSHKKQKALIDILKELFVQVETPHVSEYNIAIHPSLTESNLNGIVKRTRSSIIELYSKCEHDYKKGIDLFKDVVNHVKDTAIPGQEDSINKSIIENAYIT